MDNDSESALRRKHTLQNYEKLERNGVVIIKYDIVDRKKGALIGLGASGGTALGLTILSVCFPPAAPGLLTTAALLSAPPSLAASFYREEHVHYYDSKTGELIGYTENEASEKLNEIGSRLFEERNYVEAEKYHENAYNLCLSGYESEQTFKNNRNKARDEIQAANLNVEGDKWFNQGNYVEASRKYQEAHDASRVPNECKKYKINKNKAQDEIDAMNLKVEGDNLFNQGNYTEALRKYQEAYNKSSVESQRDTYKDQIVSELLQLNTLWDKAWETENDKSNEAKETFQSILSKCEYALEKFPNNIKFKQFETLVTLKIEGNELFNQGIDLQQSGVRLLREAHILEEQQKNDLAHEKLIKAKNAFCIAKEKFFEGSKTDQRFVSCVGIVQDHIEQATNSLRYIKGIQKSSGLSNSSNNIMSGKHVFSMSFKTDADIRNNNYYAQI